MAFGGHKNIFSDEKNRLCRLESVVYKMLALRLCYSIILCCLCLAVAPTISDSSEDNAVHEGGTGSYWPVIAAVAFQAYVTVSALQEMKDVPAPKPRRLPAFVSPLHYNLRLVPRHESGDFYGKVEILVQAVADVDHIMVHASDLVIDKETLHITEEPSRANMTVLEVGYDPLNQWLVIQLAAPLRKDSHYVINVSFKGRMTDKEEGLFRYTYTHDNQTRWLVMTNLEPTGTRYVFPSFDEPEFKATFNVSIATPPEMHTLSNMPLRDATEPVEEQPGWFWSHFEQSQLMSTYLLGFVTSDFVAVTSDEHHNFTVWVRPGFQEKAMFALKHGLVILEEMEKFTGIKYMLPKLDNVAIPHFSSLGGFRGMENWGIIMYREDIVLHNGEGDSSAWDEIEILNLLIHEIAHMWFGNLVTPSWWNELWLKEGFARYLQLVICTKMFPEWQLEEDFVIRAVHSSFDVDPGQVSLDETASTNEELKNKYSSLSYNTGGVVIRMMEHILTQDVFQRGIQEYLQKYSYRTASSQHLLEAMDSAIAASSLERILPSGVTMTEVFRPWVSQSVYPLITVTRNYTSETATVCQTEFPKGTRTWWVPLSYTTESEADFQTTAARVWLPANETCITISGLPSEEWVIFNVRQTGFYRVNYDLKNWQLLANFLNTEQYSKIHLLNRGQLLNDADAMEEEMLLEPEVLPSLMNYIHQEKNPYPWLILFKIYFQNLSTKPMIPHLERFLALTEKFTLDTKATGLPHFWDVSVEAACYVNSSLCISDAYERFMAFKTDGVQHNMLSTVYCYALKDARATEDDVSFLWHRGQVTVSKLERAAVLRALFSCISHHHLQHKALILLATEDLWQDIKDRKHSIWTICLEQENSKSVSEILELVRQRRPSLSAFVPILQAITITLDDYSEHSEIKNSFSQAWCIILMSWLTGTPLID